MTPAWGSVPVKSKVRWSPVLVVVTVILCRPRSPSWDWSWYPVADQVPSGRLASLPRSRASASLIMHFITALTVSAPYWSIRACSRSRPTLLAPTLARRASPMSSGTRERRPAPPQVGDGALELPVADDLDGRGGQRLGEHVLGRGRERPEPDSAQ